MNVMGNISVGDAMEAIGTFGGAMLNNSLERLGLLPFLWEVPFSTTLWRLGLLFWGWLLLRARGIATNRISRTILIRALPTTPPDGVNLRTCRIRRPPHRARSQLIRVGERSGNEPAPRRAS